MLAIHQPHYLQPLPGHYMTKAFPSVLPLTLCSAKCPNFVSPPAPLSVLAHTLSGLLPCCFGCRLISYDMTCPSPFLVLNSQYFLFKPLSVLWSTMPHIYLVKAKNRKSLHRRTVLCCIMGNAGSQELAELKPGRGSITEAGHSGWRRQICTASHLLHQKRAVEEVLQHLLKQIKSLCVKIQRTHCPPCFVSFKTKTICCTPGSHIFFMPLVHKYDAKVREVKLPVTSDHSSDPTKRIYGLSPLRLLAKTCVD